MTEETFKIIVPLITFSFGVVITYYLKENDAKKKKHKDSIEEITSLVGEWYNQLYSIKIEYSNNTPHSNILKLVTEYSQNRLILPKLIKHISILNSESKYQPLLKEVKGFLALVTEIKENKNFIEVSKQFMCIDAHLHVYDLQNLNVLLQNLDLKLQSINIKAGQFL
jgi:hypothetical protein